MGELKVVNGKLDIASVESLSYAELRAWMEARLHGKDIVVPGDVRQGELPHYMFTVIYPHLERHVRQDMERIIVEFVRDMARNEQSSWCGEAADELLMLIQYVGGQDILCYLLEMIEDRRFLPPEAPEETRRLHFRILQTLAALNWRGATGFWEKEAVQAPNECLGVALDRLGLIDPVYAIRLLTQVPWTEEVKDQVFIALPSLLDEYTPAKIRP